MKFNKRGQGLSLNVIIVAAIALIVLVLLVVIFTGRIGIFKSKVGTEGDSDLIKFKTLSYGDCHPAPAKETAFQKVMGSSATTAAEKDSATSTLKQEIARCKVYSTETNCLTTTCAWK